MEKIKNKIQKLTTISMALFVIVWVYIWLPAYFSISEYGIFSNEYVRFFILLVPYIYSIFIFGVSIWIKSKKYIYLNILVIIFSFQTFIAGLISYCALVENICVSDAYPLVEEVDGGVK